MSESAVQTAARSECKRQRADLSSPLQLRSLFRVLRRCCGGWRALTFTNQHQISNVNDRIWQISEDTDRIASKKKIKKHDDAAADAPIPKRNGNDAFTSSLRFEPLHEKAHSKGGVSNQAEDHQIVPVQTKKAMLLAGPRCRD